MLKNNEANADLKLRFCIDRNKSMVRVENVIWTWGELIERLKKSHADKLTLSKFKELMPNAQNARKNNGYFIGGQMKGGVRGKLNMREKNILTFDIDAGTPELLEELKTGKSGLGDIEYVVYSTRTHGGGKIKLRVVIPLGRLLPFDMFQAIARVCAWSMDPSMAAVDNVSFVPAQIMYWPAHCADVEPVFHHNRGPLLDPEAVLLDWGGNEEYWKDVKNLPASPRDQPLRENSGKKHANPLEKRGVIGAFCRLNTVHDVIEKYFPHLYVASEVGPDGVPTRYSYVPGTSSNGVVVFEEGMFIESWHGSDPISGQNVNTFDFYRIVEFGHLDAGKEPNDDPRKLKSYIAAEAELLKDPEIVRDMRDHNYGIAEDDIDDDFEGVTIDGEAVEVTSEEDPDFDLPAKTDVGEAPDENWMDSLDLNEKGIIKATLPNIVLILRNAAHFKGRFALNEFTHLRGLVKPLRSKSLKVDVRLPRGATFIPLVDGHYSAVRIILESPRGPKKSGWGMRVAERDLVAAVGFACDENPFHPVRDYLTGLKWDGKSRIDRLWVKVCHTPDTPYHRDSARLFMTASVARIMAPGTKFDYMPVLIGPQGTRKSTFVFTLGGTAWSGETPGHFDDKQKFVEASIGFWFMENGEMTHFRRAADDEAIKAVLSGTVDRVRLSYRREAEDFPRQFVLIGTTNHTNFLRDKHRRIWAIQCGDRDLDIEWLIENRDQLFAEAVASYRKMARETNTDILPLYLRGDAKDEFEGLQDNHMLADDTKDKAGIVKEWLDTLVPAYMAKPGWTRDDHADGAFGPDDDMVLRDRTCAVDIFEFALGGDFRHYGRKEALAVAEIMRHLEPEWRVGPNARCGARGWQRSYVRAAGFRTADF